MRKVDVLVGQFNSDEILNEFQKNPYKSTISFIKHNVAFDALNPGYQKLLLSTFALTLFSYEKLEPVEKGLVFDGAYVSHSLIYSFIMCSSDDSLEEIFRLYSHKACPEAFVRNMNKAKSGCAYV
jgi:hypothetical protein